MKHALIVLFLFLFSNTILSQHLKGLWQNELGSVLVIDSITTSGFVHGEYRSSSGVDGSIFSLLGWINRQDGGQPIAVSFTVRWDGYGSITSWSGFYDRDTKGPYIKTLWHLVRPNEEEPWERIITNSSTFRPKE